MSSNTSYKEATPIQQHTVIVHDTTAAVATDIFDLGPTYEAGDAEACETTTVSGETTSGTDVVLAGAAGAGDGVTTAMGTNG